MKIIKYQDFEINKIRKPYFNKRIEQEVKRIIESVRTGGDKELYNFALRFDKTDIKKIGLKEKEDSFEKAYKKILKEEPDFVKSVNLAIDRIKNFHLRQLENSFLITNSKDGTEILGQLSLPIDNILIYIPGGKAVYISTIIMNVVPAQIAGVKNIYLTTPVKNNENVPDEILATLYLLNQNNLYKIGGAHSIAAFAYGTESIPKVDKIFGPGNIYVMLAKKLLFGIVDIDMLAGPTELVIIADKESNPYFIAIDLLAQAEHDEMALTILISDSLKLIKEVEKHINELLQKYKNPVAENSIKKNCFAILSESIQNSFQISNLIAPEHLQIMLKSPVDYLPYVKNAGAVFLGEYTPTAVGDYIAGPNHTLPTTATAKFASQLSVQHFLKKTGFVYFSKEKLKSLSDYVSKLATKEKLFFHSLSVKRDES